MKIELNTLEYAKNYLSMGFSVIPLKTKDKKPALESWKPFQNQYPTTEDLKNWFDNGSNLNIGIITGKISNIVVVDLDSTKAEKYAKINNFPKTPTARTGRGLHLYYKYEDGIRNFQKRDDLPDIDLRGDGGYVVAPPSLHPSGKKYQWVENFDIDGTPIAQLPEIILAKTPEDKTPLRELYRGVRKGNRNDALARLIGSLVNDNLSLQDCMDFAISWNKDNTPPLPQEEVVRTVESIYKTHASSSLGLEKNEPWTDPIPLDRYSSLPEFPIDILPSPGKEMVEAVTEVNQVDSGLPGSIYIAVLSACVSKKSIINLETHKEPLNLYICSVAESGERKSNTVSIMTKPVYEFQSEAQESIKRDIIDATCKVKMQEKRIEELLRRAAKSKDDHERQIIYDDIITLKRDIEENPVPKNPVFIVDDVTAEALGIKMKENNERMAIFSAEGGLFSVMAGLYSEKGFNIDLYLKSHPGDPLSTHRVGRAALSMDSPSLTMGLAVQPDVIHELGKNKTFRGRGLLARFLYSFNTPKAGYRKRQHNQIPDGLREKYKKHITELLNIPLTTNELSLSHEAQIYWDGFYSPIERQMQPGGILESLKDWGSKLSGAVARIAGLLHFAQNGENAVCISISEETVKAATILGTYYIEHALAVFGLMKEDPNFESARKILEYIEKNQPDSFKGRDVIRHKNFFNTMDEVLPGLKVLTERGFIRGIDSKVSAIGRPEAISYEVNPKFKCTKNH